MDKNIKLGLIIAASIFIGFSAYASLERYLVFKQSENITTNMAKGLHQSLDYQSPRDYERMQAVA